MDDTEKNRWVRIGRVARAHGLRGELMVRADDPGSVSLLDSKHLFLRDAAGKVEQREILGARVHQGEYRLLLAGLSDRDQAEALRGREVLLPREQLPPAGEGEYYAADLVGLEAVTPDGLILGRVESVFDAGAAPVLEIRGEREWQIPFAAIFIKHVDLAAGRIEIEPPLEEEAKP